MLETTGMTRSQLRSTVVAALVAAAVGSESSAASESDASELFERDYLSTNVLKDGAPHELFEGVQIRVEFKHGNSHDTVGWRARCNQFGAPVDIAGRRLVTGQSVGTEIGCSKRLSRQDGWMVRFFSADPRWRIDREGRLKLELRGRMIKLRHRGS